ncbi:MAG: hypothetical protein K2U26_04345 [Cyclobacteriaceae bacterium]|nr:hypothetical protein [Cyclobacteriaceae bacterium]
MVVGEIVIHILFFLISKFIGKTNKDKISRASILKGILERAFIVMSLHFNMTQSITFLGALKIATRIKDTEDKVSNDFFLIGNLISILVAIGYYLISKNLIELNS